MQAHMAATSRGLRLRSPLELVLLPFIFFFWIFRFGYGLNLLRIHFNFMSSNLKKKQILFLSFISYFQTVFTPILMEKWEREKVLQVLT